MDAQLVAAADAFSAVIAAGGIPASGVAAAAHALGSDDLPDVLNQLVAAELLAWRFVQLDRKVNPVALALVRV